MLGFSVYLSQPLTAAAYNYLIAMRNAGFKTVFTSLQIPTDEPDATHTRLSELTRWCHNLDLQVMADVSTASLKRMDIDISNVGQVQSLNLTGLRIDRGVNMEVIAKLSKSMPIALNAGTLTADELTDLKSYNAAFVHLQAWYNYYPRPETGLAPQWLARKNKWLAEHDLQTMAFVPGDGHLRGPLFSGLPTLEKHRQANPLAAMIELKKLHCDHVFVGDSSLKPRTITTFRNYLQKKAITLHLKKGIPDLVKYSWHNRPDVAQDVVRLQEGRQRQLFSVAPSPAQARKTGSVTVDNQKYLHYQGELQITKCDLPADERVNVIDQVVTSDLDLLRWIDAGRKVIFAKNN